MIKMELANIDLEKLIVNIINKKIQLLLYEKYFILT